MPEIHSEQEFTVPPGPYVTVRGHGEPVRIGAVIDGTTNTVVGCDCGDCEIARAVSRDRAVLSAAREAVYRTVTADRTWSESCSNCGFAHRPMCPECGKCTLRGLTFEQYVWNEYPVHHTAEWVYLPSTPEEFARLSLAHQHGAIGNCCRCQLCQTCNKLVSIYTAGSRCALGHHVGCNCTCVECSNCHRRRRGPLPDACAACGGRAGCCCECRKCEGCQRAITGSGIIGAHGELASGSCLACYKCLECCVCANIPAGGAPMPRYGSRSVVFQRSQLKKWPATPSWGLVGAGIPGKSQINPFTRLIGAEIECGGNGTVGLNKVVVRDWKGSIVGDGSLPHTGFEINTAPAGGDMFVRQINEIGAEFERTKVWANSQCGLHVHVDCSDMRIWDMRRFINLYRRVEPEMFRLLPPTRQSNHYCMACGDNWWMVFNDPGKTRELKGRLSKALYGADPNQEPKKGKPPTNAARRQAADRIKQNKTHKDNGLRYRALNVHSWFLRGTLEFRHGSPTLGLITHRDVQQIRAPYIINWALVCAAMVEASMHMKDSAIDALPRVLSADQFVDLLPTPALKLWAVETAKVASKPFVEGRVSPEAGGASDEDYVDEEDR